MSASHRRAPRSSRLAAVGFAAVLGAAAAVLAVMVSPGEARSGAGAAPSNTTPPAVSGSPVVGAVLTASSGAWSGDTPISFSFAWQRCDSSGGSCSANGSSGQTYTVAQGDVGHAFRVDVSATNDAGSGSALSAPSSAVAAATPPRNTSLPTLGGTARQGSSLTTTVGSWSGDPAPTYAYAWERCNSSGGSCASIARQSSRTLTLETADVGSTIRSIVTATNAGGQASAVSVQSAVVAPVGAAPRPTSQPDVSGTPQVGKALTAGTGSQWLGATPINYVFSWQRCSTAGRCSAISGATKQTYVATTADVGYRLRAVVTGINAYGSGSVTTNLTASAVVSPGPRPALRTAPTLSGSAVPGSTLSTTTGIWSSSTSVTFSYSWQRCDSKGNACAPIVGATAPGYTVTSSDVGHTIRAQVTAKSSAGAATASTKQSGVVTALPTGVVKLPSGVMSIDAAAVALPDRLVISGVSFSPAKIASRGPFTARFKVTDSQGYVVRNALVYVVALPFGTLHSAAEVRTDMDGYATLALTPTLRLRPREGAIVMFVRARKESGSLLAGVSTRRLVQVRVVR